MIAGIAIVFAHAAAAVLLGWAYFRRARMPRPPLGVLNRSDVLLMMVAIILVPYVYLALPRWLVGALLGALTLGILYITLEPLRMPRWGAWMGSLALVAADLAAMVQAGSTGIAFVLVNNVVLTVTVVGVANVWAQGGMRARDAALLGGLLAVYDAFFTAWLPLMDDLLGRLAGLPFAPQVIWPLGEGHWVGLGLGDLLVATAFPLVMRKAFGRSPGMTACAMSLATVAALLGLAGAGVLVGTFPVMVVLGPLMVLQYAAWARRCGPERTTWQYLQMEPIRRFER
jgi:hypothetical protein